VPKRLKVRTCGAQLALAEIFSNEALGGERVLADALIERAHFRMTRNRPMHKSPSMGLLTTGLVLTDALRLPPRIRTLHHAAPLVRAAFTTNDTRPTY
jgi:hypothetical protein